MAEEVKIGYLAFDLFLLERWDDICPGQDRWNVFASQYLNLTPSQRVAYREKALVNPEVASSSENIAPFPPDIADFISTHQTQQERSLLAARARQGSHEPIWLKTCYDTALSDAHDKLLADVERDSLVDGNGVLGEERLYNEKALSANVRQQGETSEEATIVEGLFLRIPGLVDKHQSSDLQQQDEHDAGDGIANLSRKIEGFVWLADRQALEEAIIKVVWYDRHGRCLWWNQVQPEGVLDFVGMWESTGSLHEVLGLDDHEPKMGAILDF